MILILIDRLCRSLSFLHLCSDQDCKRTQSGEFYTGAAAVSRSGAECLPWSSISNLTDLAQFPDATIHDAGNRCRNPDDKELGVWCYVTAEEWEYCDVEMCEGGKNKKIKT